HQLHRVRSNMAISLTLRDYISDLYQN
ncbi:hypothetical protein AaE_000134, partial [Aphanomyces astaci]